MLHIKFFKFFKFYDREAGEMGEEKGVRQVGAQVKVEVWWESIFIPVSATKTVPFYY